MNSNSLLPENYDPTAPDLGRGGSMHPDSHSKNSLTRGLVAIAVMLGVVLICGLALRFSVMLVSDQPRTSADVDVNPVSRSKAEPSSERQRENERIREQARHDDRELLRRRQDRLFHEESRVRPDRIAAYQVWYREVQEIEEQIAEAERIQSGLTPEQVSQGPLAEGTVLWHRKQRLLELRSDAPQL